MKFCDRSYIYLLSLLSFEVCSGSEKCDHLGQKKIVIRKMIGTSQVETCSGPNYQSAKGLNYTVAFGGALFSSVHRY